jgi:hypothetical protein
MVRCRATVDLLNNTDHSGLPRVGLNFYEVKVWGEEPHDYVRKYKIYAKTDDAAA